MSKFFVVATPIGNLEDITIRALKVLKSVDYILAEDTRKAKILLNRYQIKKPLISYFQHSNNLKFKRIEDILLNGKDIALITEAGTPGISDPGNELIAEIIKRLGNEVRIIPIPGPSSITAIASVAGLPMQRFLFAGFIPKRKQNKFLKEIVNSPLPVIFFESPHRIIRTLKKLEEINPELKVVLARELTKKFETIYRGTIVEVINMLEKDKVKGEFVAIVYRF